MSKIKFILLEAKSINDEYTANWSMIPRDIFDRIILMDPKTDISKNNIGPNAKQLLLPKYKDGETDFINNEEAVKNALEIFLNNRNNYEIKNIAQYPSVDVFVKHINDPENNPVVAQEIKKQSKIDDIYDKYYNKIPKDTFLYIINLDENTNIEKDILGDVAKNFLLPAYMKGDNKIVNPSLKVAIINSLEEYSRIKDSIPKISDAEKANGKKDYRDIHSFTSLDELINFLKERKENSELIQYLKRSEYWNEIRYIGSTNDHDIFEPLSVKAAAQIAGANEDVGGPGINEYGSGSWSSNMYSHWCTTASGSWNSYKNDGQKYYDIMAKGSKLKGDGRNGSIYNYQIAVTRDGRCTSDADGWEHYGSNSEYWKRIVSEDPDILNILATEENYAGNLPEVKAYKNFSSDPNNKIFNYVDAKSIHDRFPTKHERELYPKFIKIINIAEGVESIPLQCFMNWSSVTQINFPSTLKRIGAEAFKNCQSLQLLRLNEGLEYIGPHAFANCSDLHGVVTLPNSLQKIEREAFLNDHIKLSILSDRKTKLWLYPDDRQWYKDNMKLVNVQKESLNTDTLDEEFLDENIPRDLAKLYREASKKEPVSHPNTNHNEISAANTNRRYVKYDYGNAEYRQISPDEALNLIRNNPAEVENLRIIFDNDLVEYEWRQNGRGDMVFYCLYGDAEKPITINGKSFRNVRYLNPKQLIPHADKIYWTDEYQHEITPESPTSQKRKEHSKENTWYSRPSHLSPGMQTDSDYDFINVSSKDNSEDTYNWKDDSEDTYKDRFNIRISPQYRKKGVTVRDTGAHKTRLIYPDNDEIVKWTDKKNSAQKIYNDSRKALQELKKNAELYDEEEFEQIVKNLEEKQAQAYQNYIDAYDNLKILKSQVYDGWLTKIGKLNNLLHKRDISLALVWKKLKQKDAELKKLQSELISTSKKSISEDPEFQEATYALKAVDERIKEYESDIADYKQSISKCYSQIEELQVRIKNYEDAVDKSDAAIQDELLNLERLQANVEKEASKAVQKINNKITELTDKIDILKDWFVETGVKKFDKKKHKDEFDTGIQDLLAWVGEDVNTSNEVSEKDE